MENKAGAIKPPAPIAFPNPQPVYFQAPAVPGPYGILLQVK